MQQAPHFLALDQGSQGSKALVFGPDGEIMSAARTPLATRRPKPAWVEHDAEALLASLDEAIDQALTAPGIASLPIISAGLASQRSSIVCWDRRSGVALSPVLSWQDRRNAEWIAAQNFDRTRLHALTGLVPSAHYGASKLRWCLDHLPEVARAAADGRLCFGPVASFVLFRLLDERPCVVDPANASRTLLWDLERRDWSAEMLRACGIGVECLPRCVASRHAFGTLQRHGRAVPLTVATGDQSAALFAWGAPQADTYYLNLGTGAFVQRAVPGQPPEAPGLLRSVAWQDEDTGLSVLEGTVNGAGAALQWLAGRHGLPAEALATRAEHWLREVDDPPLFSNGVGGLGSPYWLADFESSFSSGSDLAAETVAVLESIAFLLRVNIEAIGAATDRHSGPAARAVVGGGLASLDGLCQRLADLLGLPVERPATVEATARGVAWLLGAATASREGTVEVFRPRSTPRLQARFRRWRRALESRLTVGAASAAT